MLHRWKFASDADVTGETNGRPVASFADAFTLSVLASHWRDDVTGTHVAR